MSDINRRLKKIEQAINVNNEKHVVEIVMFCDLKSPQEYTRNNTTVREVSYSDMCKRNNWPYETFTDELTL